MNFLNTTNHNVGWFKKASDSGELDMSPPFQRKPVWLEPQKSYLIDTILNGFPIPEIYMQETIDEGGVSRHVVVDGQQRIRAILEYVQGLYPINGDDSPRWRDMYFDDLSIEEKKQIFGYNFVVRQLPAMADQQLRDIFGRLNRNTVALNAQELRRATYWGKFIHLMEDVANNTNWSDFQIFSANDIRRMLDVEFVSELTIAFLNGHQNKKSKLDEFYQLYEQTFDDEVRVRKLFETVPNQLRQLFAKIGLSRWSKKSDFYTLFLVFANHLDSLPLSEDKLILASNLVHDFGEMVTKYMISDEQTADMADLIVTYGNGVRNSADLGSRLRRFEALSAYLEPVFS
jgi:hypothetical protein